LPEEIHITVAAGFRFMGDESHRWGVASILSDAGST